MAIKLKTDNCHVDNIMRAAPWDNIEFCVNRTDGRSMMVVILSNIIFYFGFLSYFLSHQIQSAENVNNSQCDSIDGEDEKVEKEKD